VGQQVPGDRILTVVEPMRLVLLVGIKPISLGMNSIANYNKGYCGDKEKLTIMEKMK
jgi:hypothetical protein